MRVTADVIIGDIRDTTRLLEGTCARVGGDRRAHCGEAGRSPTRTT
jgi:hypothetical protein